MTARVLVITQWYEPEPVTQPGWIVDALRDNGLDVAVLTGIPNYPTGRVQSGYHAWRARTDWIDGVPVRRTPLYPSHDAHELRRIANYLSWALSSTVFGLAWLRRSASALVYSSPATAALPALVARMLFGTRYVLLIQDVWPDSIFASGFMRRGRLSRSIERVLRIFVGWTYRFADHIAVISPGMIDLLNRRGVPREKMSLVYNWVPAPDHHVGTTTASRDGLRERLGIAADALVVLYAGNHGPAQSLESAITAFAGLSPRIDAHLLLVGDGIAKQQLVRHARRLNASNVHFLDAVPRKDVAAIADATDAQLVSLARQPLFAVTMPSKLQAALQSGQPVVVAADGDAGVVVTEARAGFAVPAEDPAALRKVVGELATASPAERAEMGENGRRYYKTHMSAEVGAARLATRLRSAASRPR